MEAEGFEDAVTLCIAGDFCIRAMRRSVNLDDQPSIERYEVDDVPVNWMLAAKFPMIESTVSQSLPQAGFGGGLGCAQLARLLIRLLKARGHGLVPLTRIAQMRDPTSPLRGEVKRYRDRA